MGLFSSRKGGKEKQSSVKVGHDRQPICTGCQRVELHLEKYIGLQHAPDKRVVYARALSFHSDFAELEDCAIKSRCSTCRVFRQALLLACNTSDLAEQLRDATRGKSIFATFEFLPSHGSLPFADGHHSGPSITVEIPGAIPERSIRVACWSPALRPPLMLTQDPREAAVYHQVRQWVQECQVNHIGSCYSLRYSSTSPTRLLQISNSGVRLIDVATRASLEYVALSYPWGDQRFMTSDELLVIRNGETRAANIEQRRHRLDPRSLPASVADAIHFAHSAGVEYMWIDALCIIQDSPDDKSREMPRMHEYYGNALFTLCLASTTKATQGFLRDRAAWSVNMEPCRLKGRWLEPIINLDESIASSYIRTRAWTLQEERLSPRVLYWTPQRMYWSCSHHQPAEQYPASVQLFQPNIPSSARPDSAQSFLCSLADDTPASELTSRWLTILESFTRRDISNANDIFPAIAGLAARYLEGQVADIYIAGLWKNSFTAGLAWLLPEPQRAEGSRHAVAPSWSWASLPPRSTTSMAKDHLPASDFALLVYEPARQLADVPKSVSYGALVKEVLVRGRLRPFWISDATIQPWEKIARRAQNVEQYFFDQPEQAVVSINISRGLILSREPRKKEVIGHLDYIDTAQRMANGECFVFALEIGEDAMLLLEPVRESGVYRRIGATRGHRRRFFETAPLEDITLV